VSPRLLDGQVVIVAGVGPGMGRATAVRAAAHGASVVLAARTAERLHDIESEITAAGGRACSVATDAVDPAQCRRLADAARGAFGRIDALVHTGFARPATGPLGERTATEWHEALDGNVIAATQLVDAVAPTMREQRSGALVLVSSISARQPYVNSGIYGTMKAAMLTLTKVYAQELGPHGVRVNCVVPGYIQSEGLDAFFDAVGREEGIGTDAARARATGATALGRFPTADEVADAALFLASPMATAITGQSIDVNAGHWFG
jgi:NAD(P)-dependent dehydrogenase (short-subunit alcohol dehydrogenase family)